MAKQAEGAKVPAKQAQRKVGRPRAYDRRIADEILERLSNGESLVRICKDERFPSRNLVTRWGRDNIDGFRDRYAFCRDIGVDYMAEEILEIADDARNDWMESNDPDNPGWVANHEHINRSRIRIDTRKWYVSKIASKRYGDKVEVEHSTNDKQEIPIRPQISREEWLKIHGYTIEGESKRVED